MKTLKLTGLLIAGLFMFTLALVGQDTNTTLVVTPADAASLTNAATVNLPPGFEQVADLLGPKAKALLMRVVLWIGSLSLILAPFAVRIEHWLRDRLNLIAENNDSGKGTDAWLAKLFGNPIYKLVAVLLRFVNLNLPTLPDLERAIQLQFEAVAESKVKPKDK